MKKNVALSICLFMLICSYSTTAKSQNVKIGYFDEQSVLGLFPGIEDKLRSTLEKYVKDTLQEEYEYSYREYKRLDSNFRKDSLTLSPRQRELSTADIDKLKYKLINWQQYQNQLVEQKQNELLAPYRRKIQEALQEIVEEHKYSLVLKTESISPYIQPSILDNLSIRVAIKLKLELPKEVEQAFKQASNQNGGSNIDKSNPAKKPTNAPTKH